MSVQDIPKHPASVVQNPTAFTSGKCTEDCDNVESLMQERVGDTTVTVDEHAGNTTQEVPPPYMQGPHSYLSNNIVPPNGPMVSPLQLVYLQPTPHGLNIIPVQAAGQPTFTPYSHLGSRPTLITHL